MRFAPSGGEAPNRFRFCPICRSGLGSAQQFKRKGGGTIEELTALQWSMAGTVVLVAYLVRGIAGFGSGLIAIPLLALMLPLEIAVPLVVSLDYTGSALQGLSGRQHVKWPEVRRLLPYTVIGVLTALLLFSALDATLLSTLLGVFVLGFGIYQLSPVQQLQASSLAAKPYGFLGGLVGTLFGTGGPFYVIYFNLRGLGKDEFRATFATYFLVDGAIRIVGYVVAAVFSVFVLKLYLLALPVALVALWLGGRLHGKMSDKIFKTAISVVLIASGIALVLRNITIG